MLPFSDPNRPLRRSNRGRFRTFTSGFRSKTRPARVASASCCRPRPHYVGRVTNRCSARFGRITFRSAKAAMSMRFRAFASISTTVAEDCQLLRQRCRHSTGSLPGVRPESAPARLYPAGSAICGTAALPRVCRFSSSNGASGARRRETAPEPRSCVAGVALRADRSTAAPGTKCPWSCAGAPASSVESRLVSKVYSGF